MHKPILALFGAGTIALGTAHHIHTHKLKAVQPPKAQHATCTHNLGA